MLKSNGSNSFSKDALWYEDYPWPYKPIIHSNYFQCRIIISNRYIRFARVNKLERYIYPSWWQWGGVRHGQIMGVHHPLFGVEKISWGKKRDRLGAEWIRGILLSLMRWLRLEMIKMKEKGERRLWENCKREINKCLRDDKCVYIYKLFIDNLICFIHINLGRGER